MATEEEFEFSLMLLREALAGWDGYADDEAVKRAEELAREVMFDGCGRSSHH